MKPNRCRAYRDSVLSMKETLSSASGCCPGLLTRVSKFVSSAPPAGVKKMNVTGHP